MDGELHIGASGELSFPPHRRRLPNRRQAETQEIVIGNMAAVTATIGYDIDGRPMEIFLTNGKSGSSMEAILGDAAVVISIALQSGIPPRARAKSVARPPAMPMAPPPWIVRPALAASVIGVALDLLASLDRRGVERADAAGRQISPRMPKNRARGGLGARRGI